MPRWCSPANHTALSKLLEKVSSKSLKKGRDPGSNIRIAFLSTCNLCEKVPDGAVFTPD